MERAREVFSNTATRFADDPYDAAHGADALLILTDWEEFADLDLKRLREELRYPVIIDGRNLYRPEQMVRAGFIYSSVGRADAFPALPAAKRANKAA
jgi:UDPglucose 6-dehydrogenase